MGIRQAMIVARAVEVAEEIARIAKETYYAIEVVTTAAGTVQIIVEPEEGGYSDVAASAVKIVASRLGLMHKVEDTAFGAALTLGWEDV